MTKTKKHHWLFRLWIKIRGLLALVIVLAGLAVGLLSLLLPFETLYQDRLEKFLAKQWGLAVDVDEIDGSWRGYGPYFELSNLKLTGKQSVQLESADLSINVYQLLIPGGRTGIDLSINKAELDMIRSDQGASITINDDDDEARFTEMLDRVLTTGSLRVDEMTLNLADESGEVLLAGLKADVLLEQDQSHRALQLIIRNEDNDQSVEVLSKGLRTESLTRDAQWYIKFDQFELSNIKDLVTNIGLRKGQLKGQLDGEIWLTAQAGYIQTMTGQLNWLNADEAFSFGVKLKHQGEAKSWLANISVYDIVKGQTHWPDFNIGLQRESSLSQIKSTQVPLVWALQVVSDLGLSQAVNTQQLNQISGNIDLFELNLERHNESANSGFLKFSEFGLQNDKFNFTGLSGELEFNDSAGQMLLDSGAGTLAVPDMFRGLLGWNNMNAQMTLDWSTPKPKLAVNNLWCACGDFNLQAWSDFRHEQEKELILSSQVTAVDVTSLWKYWPHNVWKPKTLAWLDNGLLAGQVKRGFVFVHVDMVPQAFKTERAVFNSRAYTEGIDNLFHPQWPVVNNINSVAEFDHDSANVTVVSADTLGIQVNQAQVDLDSFDSGIIAVDMKAQSKDNQILDYIRKSPLVKNIELNEFIRVGGQQKIDLDFDVSVKPEVKQAFEPQGQVVFNQGQFFTEHFAIDQINGPVELDGYQLLMQDLPAQLNDAAVNLNGKIITKSETGVVIDVNLKGPLGADYLLGLIDQQLPITGQSDWNINIQNQQDNLMMTATSELSGVAINLPAPLEKTADEDKSLEIKCNIPCNNTSVEINYNNEIKSTIHAEAGRYHLSKLQFIQAVEDPSVETSIDAFGGHIQLLDLDQWLALVAQKSNPGTNAELEKPEHALPVSEVNLQINELVFMSRTFTDMSLNIKREPNSYHIQVDSEAIKGQLVIDDDVKQKGIVAEFDHLNWIDADVIDTQHKDDKESAEIPDIHLWVGQFSYSAVPLGELRMEMRNVADGIKVDQLSIKSELAEINVSGSWNKGEGALGYSAFNVVMFSEKIADFLHTMGFNAPITNAQTLVEMKAQWSGLPSQFNMATIDGALDIKIGQGQVLDQDPGFGRVLGLFNLTNLPRRLILDFRDVLSDGLLFSSMEGHFEIKSGVANTQDFLIKASSAKIHIEGDVGFADQSYAQIITVRPQIGKTFPTIGAIAGGPVGAAAGFLVQGLFDKQLKNKNEIIYQVTGTWDDPLIELISDE